MTYWFMDTSALAKRYLPENGSRWVKSLIAANENEIHISEITFPEIIAAIAGNSRAPQGISERLRDRMWTLFLDDCKIRYQVLGVSRELIDFSVELARRRKIRGCDAIQLASALFVNKKLHDQELALTLVAADGDMLVAAKLEGLETMNPKEIAKVENDS